jgi:cellulose synthase/poly-beta-1,6-N-acetylglucosamine synthase-like glycosyltransferase
VLAGFQTLAVIFCALTLPLLLELLVLTTASLFPGSRKRSDASKLRKVAIVVPAHNEGVLVERCVLSLAPQLGDMGALLVIAHNCEDDTAERAARAGADVLTLDDPAQRGKACALRFGFAHALSRGAEAVIVVDADSIVSRDFVQNLQFALSTSVHAVQCRYRVLPAVGDDRPTLTGIAFQGFNLVRPRGRDRLGLSAGIFGNGFGMRSEVLENVPYRADSVVEDLEYHIQLVAAGVKVQFMENATVYGEMPQGKAGSQTQRARWEGGRMLMVRAYLHRLPLEILKGRWRLIEPLLDLLSLPIAMAVLTLLFALAVPVPWLFWYAVTGLVIVAYHFLIAVKAGPGFWRGLRVLALTPQYILWKLLLLPRIVLNSRRDASWVRTQRDHTGDFQASVHTDSVE